MTNPSKTTKINKTHKNSLNPALVGGVIVLSVVFGFLGAFLYSWWSSRTTTSLGMAQSKNIVINEQNATIEIAKKVGPSVVSITTNATARDIFGRSRQQQGAGTGIIISKDGLILTNKHVVEDGNSFEVVTSDGKSYKDVKLIAKDPVNDIAFLRVGGANDFKPAEIGDSSKMQVGSFVVAIGNALGQYQNTVTTGVISGKSRPIIASDDAGSESLQNLFQTDAAINPGNSGGPLVNIDGQVIGINTAVAGQGSENIGFAIPINEAIKDIRSVTDNGKINRAYLGVRYVILDAESAKVNNLAVESGAYIATSQSGESGVIAGSPADKAGLKSGDIILKIDNQTIDANNSLSTLIGQKSSGDKVTLIIYRDGKEQKIEAILAEAPQE